MHFLKRKISLNKVSIAWPDIENNIEDKNKTDTDKKKTTTRFILSTLSWKQIRHQVLTALASMIFFANLKCFSF